jgi:pimeloyl-ACP methyl ester carboxylesterase
MSGMKSERFRIAIDRERIAELRQRLQRVRWPAELGNEHGQHGLRRSELDALTRYWSDSYDWTAQEAALNEFSHYRTTLQGVPIHFLHEPGRGPNPLPLILTHGWPDSFWGFKKVIRPLADPAAYGGNPADAFDVIVPSLPGYAFSGEHRQPGINYWRTADLWVELMHGLGYRRFGAHGSDWGSLVSAQLGHKYAEHLVGVHLTMLHPLDLSAPLPDQAEFAPDEQGWFEQGRRFLATEQAYFWIQATKPQTLAYAMHDSPLGQCAWIVEKLRAWSDCGGDVERRFTKDELLTTVMLYWLTDSFVHSLRFYSDLLTHPWTASHAREPVVQAPTAVAVFPGEMLLWPRSWTERYHNLKRWTRMPSGGHFAAMEEPERLVADIRAFFSGLREV